MSNNYYNPSGWPVQGQTGDSASSRAELVAIGAGFNLLPTLTGNGNALVSVNSAGTALQTTTPAALGIPQPNLSNVAGTNTITCTGTPTVTSYTAGFQYLGLAAGANTGAVTIQIDANAAIALNRPDGSALQAKDIYAANYPLDIQIGSGGTTAILVNPYNLISGSIVNATAKTAPVGGDLFGILDSAASNVIKQLTFTNLFNALGVLINAATSKATPVGADSILIQDSAASNVSKQVTFTNMQAANFTATGALLNAATSKTAPVGNDSYLIQDSAASNATTQVTFTNLFHNLGILLAAATSKTVPVAADSILIQDSAASNVSKQVTLANLEAFLGVPNYTAIAGFVLSSITGSKTTASFTISAGQTTALSGSATTQTTFITKATTTSWAVSNGNAINGTDAGSSTLANSTTYHVFMCSGASGTGSFVSSSLTPTFPTGYAVSARRIGSFNTDGSGNPLPYTSIETHGGGVLNWLATQTLDVSVSSTTSANRTLYALNVPTGIKVQPIIRANNDGGGSSLAGIFTSPDETDVAPAAYSTYGWTSAPGNDLISSTLAQISSTFPFLTTNTSGQIGYRDISTTDKLCVVTRGYIDFRRV